MLDLSSIAFKVETKELDDAVSKLGDLQKAVSNLNKPLNASTVATEKLAQAQAKTAKANADAATATAKAELAQARLEKTTATSTKATSSNTSVLERQQKILEFMTQGFSKGQSSILAYAEAAGILDSEMKQLRGTLESQRKLLGSEPFDKSLGAIKVMKNELGALRESQRQYNSGVELTVKQAKDLYREKFRLIEAMKIERDRARELGDTTVNESQRYAKLKQDLRAINTEYVALSKQRNRLADDESLQQNQRRINNLSRGLAPQISDVAVSLYGGMSPMTVLMQQGLQVRDLIQSSGVEAGKLNEVLKKTGADFIGTIGGTFKAIGGLAVGFFQSAGSGVVDFTTKMIGADAVLKSLAATSDEAAARVAKFSGVLSTIVGVGLASSITVLIALAVAMKQVIQEESALTKSINVTGLSMGLSKDAAVEYAKSFEAIGINQSKAIGVITEMAKQGGFTKEAIQSVTKAAIDLEKYAGVSIEKTVDNFAKFQDKPYEALLKVASATGLVTQAQLENIKTLETQGKQAEATAEAIRIYGQVTQAQADLSKLSLSSIETLWIDVKSSINGAWEEIKNLARGEAFVNLLSDAFKVVQTVVSTVWYSIKQLNTALGAAAAIAGAMLSGNMSGAIEIGKQFADDWKNAAKNQQGYLDNLWKTADAQTNVSTGLKLTAQQLEKNVVQSKAQAEWEKLTGDLVDRKTKREEGALRIRNQGLAAGKSELEIQKAIAVWNEKNKDPAKKRTPVSYEKTLILEAEKEMVKATDAANEYTKSWERILVLVSGADEKFNALTSTQKANVLSTFARVAAQEAENKEWEAANKIMDETSKAMKQATIEADKLAKAREQRGISEVTNAQNKLALLDEELADMLLQKAIYGDLTAEQKKQIEYAKIQKEYKAEELRITKLLADPKNNIDATKAQELRDINYLAAAKKRQNIDQAIILENNKYEYEQRVQLAAGISSSIEAALFEGGQAGSKKLREVIEAELRKPITLFIQAFVQDVFGLNSAGDTMNKAVSAFDKVSSFFSSGGVNNLAASNLNKFLSTEVGYNLGLANPTGYTTGSGVSYSANSTGSMLSKTAGQLGGSATAYGIQKTLSGGYKTGESGVVDALTAIGGFFDPTGGLIAGTIGAAVNRAFGRKLTETGIEGTFGGSEGFTGNQYSFEKGGWFRSDRTKTSALDSGIQEGFAGQFNVLRAGIALMSTSLGLGTKSIEDFTYKFKLNLMGLSEADATKKIKEEFDKVGVAIADTIPELKEYQKQGETNLDTLTRLSTSLGTVNSTFELLGFKLEDLSLSGAKAADAIVTAYGSLEAFSSKMQAYYDVFYTEDEKKAQVLSSISSALKTAGVDIGDVSELTRDGFRQIVDSLVKTKGAADPAVVALLSVAPAFASVTKSTDEAVAAAKEAADKLAKEVADKIKEAFDATKKATDDAYSSLQKSISKQKELLSSQLIAVETLANNLDSIFNLLKDNVRELYSEVTATSNMQVQQAYAIISNARTTGVLPSQDVLSQAIGTVRGSLDNTNYRTKYEADRARLLFANDLAALQGIAGEQLTEAQQQIKLLKDQIEQYDLILEHAETQINELRGINTSVLFVTSAVDALTAALIEEKKLTDPSVTKPTQSGGVGFGGGTSGKSPDASTASRLGNTYYGSMGIAITDAAYVDRFDSVNSFVNTLDWSAGNKDASTAALIAAAQQYGVSANEIAIATGYSRDDVISLTGGQLPKFANGGYHSGGLRLVGENGPELEVTGPSRIYNASQTASMLSSNSDSNETTMLRAEVRSIAISTSKLQRIIDALVVPTSEGEAINVKVVV